MQRRTQILGLVVTTLLVVSSASLGGAVLSGSPTLTATVEAADQRSKSTAESSNSTTETDTVGPYATTDWSADPHSGPKGVVVSDGTAYVAGAAAYGLYDAQGTVAAYNATTGTERWNRSDLGAVFAAPTKAGDTLYVVADNESVADPDAEYTDAGTAGLIALDADTGETKWVLDEEFARQPPVVDDGVVYAAAGDRVVAVDAQTGEKLWETDASASLAHSEGYGDVAVSNGTVYVAGANGNVTAVDSDGVVSWTASYDLSRAIGLTVGDGRLYVTGDGNETYALAASDGSLIWKRTLSSSVNGTTEDRITAPTISDGTVYVATDGGVGAVYALAADTGTERWRFEMVADLYTAPVVTDSSIYVAGDYVTEAAAEKQYEDRNVPSTGDWDAYTSTAVYALAREDGDERWSYAVQAYPSDEQSVSTPVDLAVGDRVYVATSGEDDSDEFKGRVYALGSSVTPPVYEHRLAEDDPDARSAPANAPPEAVIETTTADADGTKTVTLNASASSDSDGEVVSYEWDVDGDGEYKVTGETTEVTVPACDTVEVTLRVTDDDGDTTIRSITLSGDE